METTKTEAGEATARPGRMIEVDEGIMRSHLDKVLKGTVEETLNALLDEEVEHLCQARRYERTPTRKDTRPGHYKRKLHMRAGEVELKVPEAEDFDVRDGDYREIRDTIKFPFVPSFKFLTRMSRNQINRTEICRSKAEPFFWVMTTAGNILSVPTIKTTNRLMNFLIFYFTNYTINSLRDSNFLSNLKYCFPM